MGEGKRDFIEGYEIPSGTKVQIVRPDDLQILMNEMR